MNANKCILLGLLIRLGFVLYAEIQDRYFNLKYTDIDYSVSPRLTLGLHRRCTLRYLGGLPLRPTHLPLHSPTRLPDDP